MCNIKETEQIVIWKKSDTERFYKFTFLNNIIESNFTITEVSEKEMDVVHMFSGRVDKFLYGFTNHKRLGKEDISFQNK